MKKNFSLIATILAALIVSSCAHKTATEQKVEKEIAAVPASETKSIAQTVRDQIAGSKLTADQKERLMALEESSHAKHEAIVQEIEKTKVVLIETVLKPKMSKRELAVLKKKLTALDKQRMENGFATLTEVRKIIAPDSNTQDNEVYKAVIENRLRGL